jgi:hypothetical protein
MGVRVESGSRFNVSRGSARPSDGLEPSTPFLPCAPIGKRGRRGGDRAERVALSVSTAKALLVGYSVTAPPRCAKELLRQLVESRYVKMEPKPPATV